MRLLAAALLLLATAARADERETARQHYDEGMRLYRVGQYREAREELREAYRASPDPIFLYDIAEASRMMGDVGEAVRNYRAYLAERPESEDRAELERRIADGERLISRAAVEPAPVAASPSPEPPAAAPSPIAPAAVAAPAAPLTARRSGSTAIMRYWIAGVVGFALAAAIVTAVLLTTPNDAPWPATGFGNGVVKF